MNHDTIVALATPPGSAGIAVIRLSGPEALALLPRLHSRGGECIASPRLLVLGHVLADGQSLDTAMAVAMPGPRSFTGEDVVELQTHASPAVVRLMLQAAIDAGARLAEPGEYTKRAYLSGKLDLAQAEAVADIIAADSQNAAKLAGAQLAGRLSQKVAELRSVLVGIIAALSASLDFGEEDIDDVDTSELAGELEGIAVTMQDWLSSAEQGSIIRDGYAVAIVGLPNAGKSSLMNALVGYDRAIVTSIAGTTRDVLEERIEIDGLAVRLIDTAGITATVDVVEGIGVERAHAAAAEASLVLLTASADQDMPRLKAQLTKAGVHPDRIIGVQTKIDELGQPIEWPVKISSQVRTSSKTGVGLDELRRTIFESALGGSSEQPLLANIRHIESIKAAETHLQSALAALRSGQPYDIVTGELTLSADALASISGHNVSGEVIDAIFSKFCIGK